MTTSQPIKIAALKMRAFSSHQTSYLDQIEAYVARMPSLSTTATKVLETCNNPRSSPNDLNRLIALDPVLAGQVLRLINSAYYSLRQPVSSLSRAIIMLGVNTVKNLVLSVAILQRLPIVKPFGNLSPVSFWEHSVAVGVIAKWLAEFKGVPLADQEDYFVGGFCTIWVKYRSTISSPKKPSRSGRWSVNIVGQ